MTNDARNYAEKSESHSRRALKATRHAITELRKRIAENEAMLKSSLADLNEVKRVMCEHGWTEE